MKQDQDRMPEKRLIELKEFLSQEKAVTTMRLLEAFDISYLTLRKDLKKLEDEGVIRRVHGGVITKENSDVEEPVYIKQRELYNEEKDRIAFEASKRVDDGDSIILEAGSTIVEMVKYLKDKKNLTVITLGIPTLIELWKLSQEKSDLTVFVSGGLLLPKVSTFYGTHSVNFFESVNVDKAFIGAHAVSLENGISSAIHYDLEVMSAIEKCSHTLILLCDSSKFGKYSNFNVLPLKNISEIITDNNLGKSIVDTIESMKIKITIV